ncbi:MAG: hypothetical protein V1760_00465 [Candidatus Peregrinibacteria bacterium]
MSVKEILRWLDPKNQNLPKLRLERNFAKDPLVYIPVTEGGEKEWAKRFPLLKKRDFSGKKDETAEIIKSDQVVRFVGMGNGKGMTSRLMRRYVGQMYLESLKGKPQKVTIVCPEKWLTEAAAGIHVAALDPGMVKPHEKKKLVPEVTLSAPDLTKLQEAKKAVGEGMVIAEGKNLMRILGALPPNILNQRTYAQICMELGKKWGVPCKRAHEKELKKYQLLNAVSLGSEQKSELLMFKLDPKRGPTKEATAVVGKGLCYDSGGLIGKQDHMKSMKEDMSGSAAALGAILTIVKNKWEIKETTYFFLPLAQNMMGSKAMRADDVWMAGDGQTVEIEHTDAEGRLVLADAICYAKNNFKNIRRYYTIATLTGSCAVALGDIYTGTVCNNPVLTQTVEKAGRETGDYVHAAPWDLEYDDYKSPIASLSNLGENAREAGWIKGGLFMHHFIPKNKDGTDAAEFCHLDIAGSIDMFEKGKPWRRKGLNSGVGVNLLARLLTK